jgi:hypothetical protein
MTNDYDPTRKRSATRTKAKKILKHGKVNGRTLSKKQERFLYAQVARPPND